MSDKRILREDGIYHVYNRGNNKMMIFLEDVDKFKFLFKLKELQDIYGFDVFCYSLMTNHFHLMIKDKDINLPIIMNILQDYYTKHFNAKYSHSGHVFGGPYRSNLVIGFKHFFDLYRYILRNAVAAKIVKDISEYLWASANLDHDVCNLVNFEYIVEYYTEHGKIPLEEFLSSNEDDDKISIFEKQRMDDDDALASFELIIRKITYGAASSFPKLNVSQQIDAILKGSYVGITMRQLSEFTGLTQYAVKKICRNHDLKYL